eukprot:TRINITY_DN30830_c0_g1_i1.p1 TRINITY_DN30830_c0_g1~~TRINITY_DN30830_c0_g1_i1.p1  ORF type:complete len:182 (+),score=46.67 TRINITY_DN30830_c0_g1_i1:105-650(+)
MASSAGPILSRDSRLSIASSAVVCIEAQVSGEVIIGEGTVVHPKAKISAVSGPVRIGKNNIIEELVLIENKDSDALVIGDNNLIEVGSHIAAATVGNGNVIETKARLLKGCRVGSGCTVGMTCVVSPGEVLADNTALWGDTGRAVRPNENHLAVHIKHIELLQQTLPRFHRLEKGSAQPTV